MAFTTEFVMGAGGSVEEIPVSMSGGGSGTVYPLATVNAGSGALIMVSGDLSPGGAVSASRPDLRIGTHVFDEPHLDLSTSSGYAVSASGSVQVAILSNTSAATTFTGTVYVARL